MKSKPKDIIEQLREQHKEELPENFFEGNEIIMIKADKEGIETKVQGKENVILLMMFTLFEDCPSLREGVWDMLRYMKRHKL